MSLTGILNTASTALSNVDFQISVGNENIANAGDTSYSRKQVVVTPMTPQISLTSSSVSRVASSYLTGAVVSSSSDAARDQAVNSILQNYDTALGSTTNGDDLSSELTTLQTALTNVSGQGGDAASKGQLVTAAQQLATGISSLSTTIQTLRTQANNQISDTVNEINSSTSQIDSLNRQIVATQASGGDVTSLEDQRDTALQTLSSDIGVSYYVTPDNRMQVYTSTGQPLVGANAMPLSYSGSGALSSSSTYPGTISGITLGGQDITTSISTGKLAGLVNLRDTTLPNEQSKLDTLAQGVMSAVNTASNAGTASPPPSSLTGTTTVAASDAFSATGTLRVTVTDASGNVTATQDIDLSGDATVQDVVNQLNGVSGLTAQINAQGQLSLSTASGSGVALADISSSVSPNGSGVSAYFGLNNIFTGTDATNIAVNPAMVANTSLIPTAKLSTSSTLAAGDLAVASGDTTNADAISSALTALQTFPAAGGFAAQSTNVQSYATAFVSAASNLISNASTTATNSEATFTAAQTRLQNLTNVNTDEELANLQTLEQQYQANAQMISTVRTMFSTLMTMMNG